jgi:hypothetical protein
MSPVPRRDLTPFVVLLVVGAVVLFLLVGGLASVGRSSGRYRISIDQSFAAQARVLVSQSNQVGSQLRTVVAQAPDDNRTELTQALDALVAGADEVERAAVGVSAAQSGVTQAFSDAMEDRAVAVSRLSTAVDGLLKLTPASDDQTSAQQSPFPPPAVTSTQATRELSSVGSLLLGADSDYREARRLFAKAPGGSTLPESVWVPTAVVWDQGAVQTVVNELTSAPNLDADVDVQLVAVALDPPVLPPAPGQVSGQPQAPPIPSGASEVPPTCTLSVTAVVRNQGSVVVSKVAVEASVQKVSGGAPFVVRKLVTLGPAASTALSLPVMPVSPATSYNLSVTLAPPPGQSPAPAAMGGTIAVASFGSAKSNARCAQTPAAAP